MVLVAEYLDAVPEFQCRFSIIPCHVFSCVFSVACVFFCVTVYTGRQTDTVETIIEIVPARTCARTGRDHSDTLEVRW